MSKTLLTCLLLISPYELVRAIPTAHAGVATSRQSPAPPAHQQYGGCDNSAGCRAVIKKKKEEIKLFEVRLRELEGSGADPRTKTQRQEVSRSLKKSRSELESLKMRAGETSVSTKPSAGGGAHAEPSPTPLTLPLNEISGVLRAAIEQSENSFTERTEKNGNIHIVKALSVGIMTVDCQQYAKAGEVFQLKMTITPNNIIEESLLDGFSNAPVTFYVRPTYKSRKSRIAYNTADSNGTETRVFTAGKKMLWVWDVTPSEGFDSDEITLDLNTQVEIGDRKTEEQKVVGPKVEFKESGIKSWFYSNVLTLIGLLMGLVSLIATGFSILRGRKLKKLRQDFEKQQVILEKTHRELIDLTVKHRKLQSEYDDIKRKYDDIKPEYDDIKRWEHHIWLW